MFKVILSALIIAGSAQAFAMGGMKKEEPVSIVNQKAPDFTLENTAGQTLSMEQVRNGQKAVIMFWATWCPHCHDALLTLNEMLDRYERSGVKVMLVNLGEPRNDVKAYLQYKNIQIDTFLDPDSSTQELYQVIGVPTIYMIDADGTILSMRNSFPRNLDSNFGKKL